MTELIDDVFNAVMTHTQHWIENGMSTVDLYMEERNCELNKSKILFSSVNDAVKARLCFESSALQMRQ